MKNNEATLLRKLFFTLFLSLIFRNPSSLILHVLSILPCYDEISNLMTKQLLIELLINVDLSDVTRRTESAFVDQRRTLFIMDIVTQSSYSLLDDRNQDQSET